MRTTLTIDDALLDSLKKRAIESGKPFKQIVNETLLAGLQTEATERKPYRLQPAALGTASPGINLDKALLLAGELEDQALIAKMELHK